MEGDDGTSDAEERNNTDVLQPIAWTSASLSLFGNLSLLLLYYFHWRSCRRRHQPTNFSFKLIMYLSLAQTFSAFGWYLVTPDNEHVCLAGAVLGTYFFLCTFFCCCCIALDFYLSLTRNVGSKYELVYISLCTLLPLVCTIIPAAMGLYDHEIPDNDIGCWFNPDEAWSRIVFFDGWIFFAWVFIAVFLILGQREIHRQATFTQLMPSVMNNSIAHWSIVRNILLIFILCWTWSLIIAIATLVGKITGNSISDTAMFVLLIFFSLFCPLQGFLNFVFFVSLNLEFRQNYLRMWHEILFCDCHRPKRLPRNHTSYDSLGNTEPTNTTTKAAAADRDDGID